MSSLPESTEQWFLRRAHRNRHPEALVALGIMVLWALLAGLVGGGVILVLLFLTVALIVHLVAVESGSHGALWSATGTMLFFIVVAAEGTLGGLAPLEYTIAGASALVHNELVRVGYARRREAVVDDSAFLASGVGIAVATALGIIGVVLLSSFSSEPDRAWGWMPVAVAVLVLAGAAMAIGPAVRSNPGNKERFEPGVRIPPPPLGREDSNG